MVLGETSLGVHVWQGGCVVEGHRGLLTYTPTLVRVRRRKGAVTIEGERLGIVAVTCDEIWLTGAVHSVGIDG